MTSLFATTLLAATVVVTCGVLFLLETLLRRDTGAGRIWSLAFLSGILTVVCYLVWAISSDGQAWIAIGFGNAALVATIGFLWLGCRAFNSARLDWSLGVLLAACLGTVVAVLLEGPGGGDWAGAVVTFLSVAGFAVCGAVETRRGRLGGSVVSLGLTAVLTVTATYYSARAIVFATLGPDSEFFETYFGHLATAILTTVLTIVAMMTGSILRAEELTGRPAGEPASLASSGDILGAAAFDRVLAAAMSRARANRELVALVALRMDDLPQIRTAFGAEVQAEVAEEWRTGIRKYAPGFALVGEGGPTTMLVAFQPSTAGSARRTASRIHRRIVDDYTARPDTPTPVIGVGVSLTESFGYDVQALRRAADDAAFVSASSPDASVVVAGTG
ncbi:hypothetical protein [Microbacterium sp. BK668]|uniref:hypothetical protein n=1 Tax=Microbacterium sp. BK668 TaxID=2512118 RepID=UPI0010605965|nr:hypothetical protein [Microbacterium sp. BK668]TDN93123.1 GGDEF domain-containing protein [Microbacterium sp. BK668]